MRLWLTLLARSGRFVGPLAAELLLLLLVYAYAGNPVRDSYGATALYLVALGAWMGLALLDAADPGVRDLAVVRRGRLRTDASRLAAGAVLVAGMALLAVVAPAVAGAFDRPPTAADLVAGLLAHLACGAIGLGLAACLARPIVARAALAGAAIVAALLAVAATGLPPMSLVAALHDDGALAGPLLAAAGLAAALLAGSIALTARR